MSTSKESGAQFQGLHGVQQQSQQAMCRRTHLCLRRRPQVAEQGAQAHHAGLPGVLVEVRLRLLDAGLVPAEHQASSAQRYARCCRGVLHVTCKEVPCIQPRLAPQCLTPAHLMASVGLKAKLMHCSSG